VKNQFFFQFVKLGAHGRLELQCDEEAAGHGDMLDRKQ
jgi:hypothetical protein